MTHLGYLLVGWGVTLGVGAAYSWRLIRRGLVVAGRVPESRRRWMTADNQ